MTSEDLNNKKDSIVISGSGLWIPEFSISNEELVDSLNSYAEKFNKQNADKIAKGELQEKPSSNADFITKASGITNRYVYRKEGILDINRMTPAIEMREVDELSHQAEMAVNAARKALKDAGKKASEIDAVIVSCAYTQRAYPAIAIEVQHELGIQGFAFDMLVACSAGTFALQRAYEMVTAGTAKSVLVINPELTSPQLDYTNRDSHFIFGDIATATVIEKAAGASSSHQYQIISTKALTQFSNNIRSDFGHLARAYDHDQADADIFSGENLFRQEGRKVFKDVCPMASNHITEHLNQLNIEISQVKRWWLHQANINMNKLITKTILGRAATAEEAPIVLDRFANTASAGSIIAFNLHHQDLQANDIGLLCSFGAGYSIGSLVLQKL